MKSTKTTRTSAKKKIDTPKSTKKVKDVEFKQIDNKFSKDDSDDRRLIVFIALAILVIVGTIIGLLVGCQKEEKEEPKKPQDDIVVPAKDEDKKEDKQSYDYDYEKPLPVVRKVTTKKESKETTDEETVVEEETPTEETETTTHNVTFYIDEESETEEVEDGEVIPSHVPDGYTDCSYYADSELTEEINLETVVTEDMEVYMTCSVVNYTIVYEVEGQENMEGSYSVKDGEIPLTEPRVDNGEFWGWFIAEEELTTEVTALNKDILQYADENNVIHLRAKILTGEVIVPEEETNEGTGEEGQEENLEGVQTLNMGPTRGLMILEDEEQNLDDEEKELDELETEEVPDEVIVTEEDKEEPNADETVVEESKEVTEEANEVEEPKEESKELPEENTVEPTEEVKEEEEKKDESVPVVVEEKKEPEKESTPTEAPVTPPVVVSPPENEPSVEETNNSE